MYDGSLTSARATVEPDVRVATGLKEVSTLVDDTLEFLAIGEVVSREFLECLVVFTPFDHFFHFNDDLVQLSFLFGFAPFRHLVRHACLVQRQRTILE